VSRFELRFGRHAARQWRRLDIDIRKQFARKLDKLLDNPHVPAARMRGYSDAYRVKLRKAGFRLVYRVFDDRIVVLVVAVGKRDKDRVYEDFALNYNEGTE